MHIAQAHWETSADGIGFMDATLETLKASFEAIRDMAMNSSSRRSNVQWHGNAKRVST